MIWRFRFPSAYYHAAFSRVRRARDEGARARTALDRKFCCENVRRLRVLFWEVDVSGLYLWQFYEWEVGETQFLCIYTSM